VKLLGRKLDWVRLREFAFKLAKYDLEWWIENILEILSKFILAFD